MKKSSESSRREKQLRASAKNMKINTRKVDAEIKKLAQRGDADIDTSDIPEIKDWGKAVAGKFYRAIKKPITIRLDTDLVDRLKSEGPGYQTKINTILRSALKADEGLQVGEPPTDPPNPTRQGGEKLPYEACEFALVRHGHFQFPNLQRQEEIARCFEIAEIIKKRQCVFAEAS
jgi:uncharacterized protein (DUF4415 family)